MNNKIIVDSCCDLTEQMKQEMGITSVPIIMMLDNLEFVDDETLNLSDFMQSMKNCKGRIGSASPSPYLYQEAIQNAGGEYIITLSEKLSGSYGNAVLGNNQAVEETGKGAYVFDSKSASAGETLIAIKLHDLICDGLPKPHIIEAMKSFIDNMKTYFILESFDNLQKNGRLGKITGSLIQILNMKLIMGANGDGEIALFQKVRGMKSALEHLLLLIEKSGKPTENETLVITHCNNSELAEELRAKIKNRFSFKNIFIVPTGGLSSMYTDDRSIVMAF